MRGAVFEDCVFETCNFTKVDFRNAFMYGCSFENCSFDSALFGDGVIQLSNFNGCDWKNVYIRNKIRVDKFTKGLPEEFDVYIMRVTYVSEYEKRGISWF